MTIEIIVYGAGSGHLCETCGQDGRFAVRLPGEVWHTCCVAAWNFWIAPSDHVRHLKAVQKRRCLATGERLLRSAEVEMPWPWKR